VVQRNTKVMGGTDLVYKLRCIHKSEDDDSAIESTSLNVDTVDVVSVSLNKHGESETDVVDCYLDVQTGRGPFSHPVNGFVSLGDSISLVVYASGGLDHLHVQVRDCIGHNGDISNSIQLTNQDGRVIRSKLIGPWQTNQQDAGGEIITWAYAKAFRFPERSELFFECNVDICRSECPAGILRTQKAKENVQGNSADEEESDTGADDGVASIRVRRGIRVMDTEGDGGLPEVNSTRLDYQLDRSLQQSHTRPKVIHNSELCLSSPLVLPLGGSLLVVLIVVILVCVYLSIKVRRQVSEQEEKLRPSPASSIVSRDLSLRPPSRNTLRDGPPSGRYPYPSTRRTNSRDSYY